MTGPLILRNLPPASNGEEEFSLGWQGTFEAEGTPTHSAAPELIEEVCGSGAVHGLEATIQPLHHPQHP